MRTIDLSDDPRFSQKSKKSKYGAKKVTVDGIDFDSQKERTGGLNFAGCKRQR